MKEVTTHPRGMVAKVDALTALCDQMAAALTTADTTRALLHEAPDLRTTASMEAAE